MIFVSENLTELATATLNVSLHASYPLNLTFPKPECQMWNRTWEEHEAILREQEQAQTCSISDDDGNSTSSNNEDAGEWKLVSHFGPLTSQYRPRENTTNTFTCKPSKVGLKLEPDSFIWHRSNSSIAVYVPQFVHSSYPDDAPIPPPRCKFRRNQPIPGLEPPAFEPQQEDLLQSPLMMPAIIAGLVLLLIVLGSYFYLVPPPKKKGDDDAAATKPPPLTFSQKLFQQMRGDSIGSSFRTTKSSVPSRDGWARVVGPSQDLAIQWTDSTTFVARLLPKDDGKKTKDPPGDSTNKGSHPCYEYVLKCEGSIQYDWAKRLELQLSKDVMMDNVQLTVSKEDGTIILSSTSLQHLDIASLASVLDKVGVKASLRPTRTAWKKNRQYPPQSLLATPKSNTRRALERPIPSTC